MYFDGGLPLHAAVRCGDVAALRRVVQSASEGEDTEDTINQKDKYGQTPLFIACMERNIQMVHSLLLLGADVNSPSGTFSYPLHVACDNQSNDVAVVLLDNGAAVNCQDRHEFTPLMLAVNRQDTKCIASLLSRGARTDIRNRYQLSALTMACRLGNILIVRQLILFGADVNEIGEHPPLLSACEYGDIDILHLLIGSGADVNVMIDGWSILFHYVESCRSPCKQTEDAITDVLNALWLGGLTITQELCDKISYLVESTLHPFYKLFVNWLKKVNQSLINTYRVVHSQIFDFFML